MSRRTRRAPSEASTRVRGLDDDGGDVLLLLAPLDGAPGPARRLSPLRFASRAAAIAELAARPVGPPVRRAPRRRSRRAMTALTLMLAAIVVAGAVGVWASHLS